MCQLTFRGILNTLYDIGLTRCRPIVLYRQKGKIIHVMAKCPPFFVMQSKEFSFSCYDTVPFYEHFQTLYSFQHVQQLSCELCSEKSTYCITIISLCAANCLNAIVRGYCNRSCNLMQSVRRLSLLTGVCWDCNCNGCKNKVVAEIIAVFSVVSCNEVSTLKVYRKLLAVTDLMSKKRTSK